MTKIMNKQNYKIKASKELKNELNAKIKRKVDYCIWYIYQEAKKYGLTLDISANISEDGKVTLFFIDESTAAMFDTAGHPLALSVVPSFKSNENGEITGIERIEINPRDVENWTKYFRELKRIKNCLEFFPKWKGGR